MYKALGKILIFYFRAKSNGNPKKRNECFTQSVRREFTDLFSSCKTKLFHVDSVEIDSIDGEKSTGNGHKFRHGYHSLISIK